MIDLFTTRTATYRERPSEEDEDLIIAVDELRSLESPTDADAERLATLEANQVLVPEYRYTIGVLSVLDGNRRDANLRKERAYILDTFGTTVSDFLNLSADERDDGYGATLESMNIILGWATIIVAVKVIEERQADMLSDFATPWAPVTTPDTWGDIEGFLGGIDRELLRALMQKTESLNPGMFLWRMNGESSKKFGVLSKI